MTTSKAEATSIPNGAAPVEHREGEPNKGHAPVVVLEVARAHTIRHRVALFPIHEREGQTPVGVNDDVLRLAWYVGVEEFLHAIQAAIVPVAPVSQMP